LKVLISFDIDGTLEVGDPPGPVTLDMVRRARESGCIIGTCSDRPLSAQQELMDGHNIQVDFVSLKHKLGEVMASFEAERYYHTGDTELDQQFALRAGFDFIWMDAAASEPWVTLRDDSQGSG
jgi:hydroxymethylpyrimidine pyrophosphatase-like HAD family hydrolase